MYEKVYANKKKKNTSYIPFFLAKVEIKMTHLVFFVLIFTVSLLLEPFKSHFIDV